MAVLYISEYSSQARDGQGYLMPAGQEPSQVEQQVAIGAGSTQSTAFAAGTKLIRVHCDVACHVSIGTNPTAATTTKRLAANQTEFFGVQAHPRTGDKIAVIEGS
jgi:hypothetical protein